MYAITVNPVPSKYMYPQEIFKVQEYWKIGAVLIKHNSLRNDAKSKSEWKKKKKKKVP